MRSTSKRRHVVKSMIHGAHHVELLQQDSDSLRLINTGLLTICGRILAQRIFKTLGDTNVVHHQPGRFVPKYSVDAGYGLHKPVPTHRLVDVHRVHARGIKSRQPHIPHDHQLERIIRIPCPLGEKVAPSLGSDVLLPLLRITCGTSHNDLERAFIIILTVPFRA